MAANKVIFLSFFLLLSYQNIAQVASSAKEISPLLIGEKVPDVKIISATGKESALLDLVSTKPTLIVFYRGGWCPYCNLQLSAMNNIKEDMIELGYQIIAIGTDAHSKLQKTVSENKLTYEVYSDASTKISQAFGIAFEASETKKKQLKKTSNDLNPGNLPVPSVFVVDQEGYIQFEYINPNYKVRLKEELLMAVLQALSE